MIQFKSIRPILWTNNLEESITFYCTVLGFKLDEKNADWGWASLTKEEVNLMLALPNEHTFIEKIGFSGSLYFEVTEVDKLWEEIKDKAKICYPPEVFEWGMKEFALYDNNGYLLQFGTAQ
ncbi:MAG: VOC family protein [Flavobacterium sp.]|jgi:uncharacterized glyoxalase superfamily protein PhnB|uniref:VOC family protein n=1 Tax=Flavobacterium sp. TaxID=239 RepID=UPI0035AFEEFD